MLGELVTIKSAKGLSLDGICYQTSKNRTTVLHVHGSFGNFYQNRFIRLMAKMYSQSGLNLISVNMAGHDGFSEGYRLEDDFEYVGGALSDFNECVGDIEGVIQYAEKFSDRIILQGHSLGCDRVLQFLITTKKELDFVLLSPCDSYQLQMKWIAPETVEEQIKRLKNQAPSDPHFDWLPSREYGIAGDNGWTYPIPITRKAFLSIADGPPYRLMKIKAPADFQLRPKALIYIGGKDELQSWPHMVMFKYLKDRIPGAEQFYVPGGDHMLAGCEEQVIEKIVQWVSGHPKG